MQISTDDSSMQRQLAFRHLQERQFAKAEVVFDELLTAGSVDPQVRFGMAMALYEQARLEDSREHLRKACALEPNFVHAWLYLGVVDERLGERERAAGAYLRADRLMGRVDPAVIPPDVKQLLNHGANFLGKQIHTELSAALVATSKSYGDNALPRMRKAIEMFSGRQPLRYDHPRWRPGLFYVPDMTPRTFLEREEFPWVQDIEAQTDHIRDELRAAMGTLDGKFTPYIQHEANSADAKIWGTLNQSTDWSTLHLARYGQYDEQACGRCPLTTSLLRANPDLHDVPGYGPEIMFSVLRPKTLIPSHRGSVNGRLIVHLPLIVPPQCGSLRVGDDQREWEEGKLLIFDDTFDHEARNDSEQTRIVLIFDIWNPQLSLAEREAFRKILATAASFEKRLLES